MDPFRRIVFLRVGGRVKGRGRPSTPAPVGSPSVSRRGVATEPPVEVPTIADLGTMLLSLRTSGYKVI